MIYELKNEDGSIRAANTDKALIEKEQAHLLKAYGIKTKLVERQTDDFPFFLMR